jgi:hypothetical protein
MPTMMAEEMALFEWERTLLAPKVRQAGTLDWAPAMVRKEPK